jgi:hypothetical protein
MQSVIAELAHRAWIALAIAASGAMATLLLSYFHTLRKIVESPDIVSSSHRIKWPVTFGKSLQGAVTSFCLRTLPLFWHTSLLFTPEDCLLAARHQRSSVRLFCPPVF